LIGATWLGVDVVTDHSVTLDGDRFEQIDTYVAEQLGDSRIPGASIAIVEDGAIAYTAGFGDDGSGNAITADTPFWIGSNTKSITALAVMQLVDTGVIDLDASVQTYLPEFRVSDPVASEQITIRHLLNQTSGISRSDGLRAVVTAEAEDSIDDVVADMADLELNRPVGERFEYANLNSVVLGAVVEAVTGRSWQDYVEVNIFEPLGMDNTYTDKASAEANGLTDTFRFFFGFPIEADADHYASLAASGYVYSTANDMARYLAMYLQGGELDGQRVLDRDAIDEMLTADTNERTFPLQSQSFTASYGAGWFVGSFGVADDARWHQGSLPHFTAWMVLLPDTDQGVVVMLNAGNQFEIGGANSTWSSIPQGIVNLLRDADPPAGTSTSRFFIIFTTLAVMAVIAQAGALVRATIHLKDPLPRSVGHIAPLAWELVAAPLVLLAYPGATGGLGWGAAFSFVPDLSLTVLTIASLAVLTGIARTIRLLTPLHRRTTTNSQSDVAPLEQDPVTVGEAVSNSDDRTPVRQLQ
jgi:CubicO group peptidase (beta-lactamase class C family)